MKFKLALPLLLVSAVASAEQYQSITDADYIQADYGNVDVDTLGIQSIYYFAPRETVGPLKEFEYINRTANIYGSLLNVDTDFGDSDTLTLGGEYFTGQWKVGGQLNDSDDVNAYSASLGYFFTPNFLAEVEAVKVEDQDTDLYVSAQYNHQLNGSDYIGFSATVDDDFDHREVSTKYFTALAGGRYLTAELALVDNDNADFFWAGDVEFFFSQNTSVGFGYDENENYELNATHFFNRNVAAKVAYGSNSDFNDLDVFSLGMTVQL